MKRIEKLRSELSELVNEHGLLHPFVLSKSKQLDKVIYQYLKRISDKKERKLLLVFLQKIEKKHTVIENMYCERYPVDPLTIKKKRELDMAIVDYIQLVSAFLTRKTIHKRDIL